MIWFLHIFDLFAVVYLSFITNLSNLIKTIKAWFGSTDFFDIIELMILGFGVDLLGFASAGALPFPGGIAIVTQHIDNSPHLTSNPS